MPLELLKIKADKSQFCTTSCTHAGFFLFTGVSFCCLLSMQYSHSALSLLFFLFLFPFLFLFLFLFLAWISTSAPGSAAVWSCHCKPLPRRVQNWAGRCWASAGLEHPYPFFFSPAIPANRCKQIDCCCLYNVIPHIRLWALNLLDNVYLAGKQFVSLFYCQQDIELQWHGWQSVHHDSQRARQL